MLSAYRLMWMMVMFDLPVVSATDRKKATKFRAFLEKEGFQMCQFSVYARFCGTRDRSASLHCKIEDNIPEKGKVSIIEFTDKQFGDIVHLLNKKRTKEKSNPEQLLLFEDS